MSACERRCDEYNCDFSSRAVLRMIEDLHCPRGNAAVEGLLDHFLHYLRRLGCNDRS